MSLFSESLQVVRQIEALHPYRDQKRVFRNLEHLVRACGCTAKVVKYRPKNPVGRPPDPYRASLMPGGVIYVTHRFSKQKLAYDFNVAHEAIHHFHGEAGFRDEGTMMPLELGLYLLVQDTEDRRQAVNGFLSSFDEEDEIACQIDRYGGVKRYFKSRPWKNLLKSGAPWVVSNGRVRTPVLNQLLEGAKQAA